MMIKDDENRTLSLRDNVLLFLTLLQWLQLCISSFISSSFSFSAATCASYNFSFLSPQGLNFSSQSSAPFWSGTLSFLLSFLAPVVFLHLINCNFTISLCALDLSTSSLWCSFHMINKNISVFPGMTLPH